MSFQIYVCRLMYPAVTICAGFRDLGKDMRHVNELMILKTFSMDFFCLLQSRGQRERPLFRQSHSERSRLTNGEGGIQEYDLREGRVPHSLHTGK